jgi:hypothetical protein
MNIFNTPKAKLNRLRAQENYLQIDLLKTQEKIRRELSFDKPEHGIWGERHILCETAPWESVSVELDIPHMLTMEDARYISWIARKLPAGASVLELGPWLGMSTNLFVRNFLHPTDFTVVDDFIWRNDWMAASYQNSALSDGDSFLPLFQRLNANILEKINVQESVIEKLNDNSHLPLFMPQNGRYLLCFIDCGRTYSLNESWWNRLKQNLIPGSSLLILQDFNTHKEVPKRWYNQIKDFVDSKEDELDQLHELKFGGIASFVYIGKTE